MANNETTVNALFVYRLTFGNTVTNPKAELDKLQLEQSVLKDFTDKKSNITYSVVLHGVKVNKKIYQPCEIEVELDYMQITAENTSKAPSFQAVSTMFLQRQVKVEIIHVNRQKDTTSTTEYGSAYTVAENCYVYEVNPQLKRESNGTKMFVKLNIFSMDKLMTLNKYSKAYVARKLGSGILEMERDSFGKQANDHDPLIQTDISGIQFLRYPETFTAKDKDGNDQTYNILSEFIHPYLVQYNESFYDFLVRTANRCGEFLFFEDGKLTLGLPLVQAAVGSNESPLKITYYESVTKQDISDGPFKVQEYVRDSVKDDKGEMSKMNFTPIEKGEDGYPKDAFPEKPVYNAEVANDDYIFPVFKDKFSSLARELYYDGKTSEVAIAKAMQVMKSALADKTEGNPTGKSAGTALVIAAGIAPAVAEAFNALFGKLGADGKNTEQTTLYVESLKSLVEQASADSAVQFATLDPAGWTKINYFRDVHSHQADQQRQIICINMGTGYAPVKLGQPIQVEGLDDDTIYVVIQIQQLSEEAWNRDYDTYGSTTTDKFSGKRSQKIYAIPAYKNSKTDTVNHFIPPVHPVPIIRHSGPQTAFVCDNADPKFQGRVRIAFPWQSIGQLSRQQLAQAEQALTEAEEKQKEKDKEAEELKGQAKEYSKYLDEVKAFLNMSAEERKAYLEECKTKRAALSAELTSHQQKKAEYEAIRADKAAKIDTEKDAKTKRQLEAEQVLTEMAINGEDAEIARIQKEIDMLDKKMKFCEKAEENEKIQKANDKDYTIDKNKTVEELTKKYEQATKGLAIIEKEKTEADKAVEERKKAADAARATLQKDIAGNATPWIRIATPMATNGGGFYYKPRIGDEVFVNFDNDNIERPYVVGTLYSKNTLQPAEGLDRYLAPKIQQGKNLSMSMMSPNGHHITFTDPEDGMKFIANLNPGTGFLYSVLPGFLANAIPKVKEAKDLTGGIHIGDRYGLYEIQLSSHAREVSISSALGKIKLNAFTGISINAPNGDISITGQNINIAAGNKLSITSGNNILPPNIGDPDFDWKKAFEWNKWQDTFKIPFRALGKGLHYLGHSAILPGAIAGAAVVGKLIPLADLSFFRCLLQTFMRPIDGTMLIKSKKYMMLEAGNGTAMVNPDRYKDLKERTKRQNGVYYNALLINAVSSVNTKIDNYFATYNDLWKKAAESKQTYQSRVTEALVNANDPNILNTAWGKATNEEWGDMYETYNGLFEGKLKPIPNITMARAIVRRRNLVRLAVGCGEAVFNLHKQINSFEHLFDVDPRQGTQIDDCLKAAFDKAKTDVAGYLNDLNDTNIIGGETDEEFKKKMKLLKRKIVAHFLLEVSKTQANKEFDFITIGYNESNIKESNLKQDYYWKRFMQGAARGFTSEGKFMGKVAYAGNLVAKNNFLASAYESLMDVWKKQFEADKWKMDVWDASQAGQLLISDNGDATVHINSGGEQPQLEQEKDANYGNEKRLWKLVLDTNNL